MDSESKKLLILSDLRDLYKKCTVICNDILKANSNSPTSFVFYKYIHLESIFKYLSNPEIKTLRIIYPSSKVLSGHNYEAMWVENGETLNLVADLANIYIANDNETFKNDILYTLPVWSIFIKKIIRLFRGITVVHIRY